MSDFVCLFENILSNLNKFFLKKHCILQKILLAARIPVRRVSHGLKYRVFCHRQRKHKAINFRLSLSIGMKMEVGVNGRCKYSNEGLRDCSPFVKFWKFTLQMIKYKQIKKNYHVYIP